jgi:hypothetical protein
LSIDELRDASKKSGGAKGSGDNPENQLKLVLYLLNHDKENYQMFFWSKNNLFDKYFPEFDRMINTIKWVD